MKTILLIDDCNEYRETTAHLLLDEGYDVFDAASPMDALPHLQRERFDLIICDLHMPFSTGPEQKDYVYSYEVGVKTIHELKDVFPNTPIIALSNTSQSDLNRISEYLEPVQTFMKPFHNQEILSLIQRCLNQEKMPVIQ